jgi:hypothetical protein
VGVVGVGVVVVVARWLVVVVHVKSSSERARHEHWVTAGHGNS